LKQQLRNILDIVVIATFCRPTVVMDRSYPAGRMAPGAQNSKMGKQGALGPKHGQKPRVGKLSFVKPNIPQPPQKRAPEHKLMFAAQIQI
jgi:hypothetical protein